jgi:hypothetical protein
VGDWRYGSVSPTNFYSDHTGAYSGNAYGFSRHYTFFADGSYKDYVYIYAESYGCRQQNWVEMSGTVQFTGASFTTDRHERPLQDGRQLRRVEQQGPGHDRQRAERAVHHVHLHGEHRRRGQEVSHHPRRALRPGAVSRADDGGAARRAAPPSRLAAQRAHARHRCAARPHRAPARAPPACPRPAAGMGTITSGVESPVLENGSRSTPVERSRTGSECSAEVRTRTDLRTRACADRRPPVGSRPRRSGPRVA